MFVKFFGYHNYYSLYRNKKISQLTKPKLFVSSGNDVAIHYLLGHHWLHEYSAFLWGNYTKHRIILFIKM